MEILSFGHIPSYMGGRQSSGLANVIYQLAYHVSKYDGVKMTLAATDVFVPELHRDELTIMGWSKDILIKHIIKYPITALKIFLNTLSRKVRYSSLVSIPGLLLKSLFLDYVIRMVKPQVVHLHGVVSLFYFQIVPSTVKLVVTLHGNVGNDARINNHLIYARLEKNMMKSNKIDMLCLIASSLEDIFRTEYGEIVPPVKIILNAYDDNVFKLVKRKNNNNKLTLCTIASYSERKGQDRVIEALKNSGCDYRYLCVGYISDEDKMKLIGRTENLDFKWLGVKEPVEIREILSECDYMILPSSSEGFGLVYLEAIACGVPVIIPKHLPLAKESNILNNSNAIRIEDHSSKAIEEVLPSLKERHWDRKSVAESIISYNWDNIAKEYVAQYKSLIKE